MTLVVGNEDAVGNTRGGGRDKGQWRRESRRVVRMDELKYTHKAGRIVATKAGEEEYENKS